MVYAIVENLIFLLIAAFLGGILGWLLRGPRLRKQLRAIWQRRVDEEHGGRKQAQQALTGAQEQVSKLSADLETVNGDLERSQQALVDSAKEAGAAKQELAGLLQDSTRVTGELEAARGAAATAEATAKRQGEALAQAKAEAERLQAELAMLETQRTESDADRQQLADALAAAQQDQQGLTKQLAAQTSANQALEAQLAAKKAELAEFRDRLVELESLAAEVENADEAGAPESAGSEEPQQLQAAVHEIAQRTAGEQPVADDDLKQIRGIGPVLERQLKELGITSFRQIAQFSDQDIERVSAALGAFRGRIQRDNWPAGAAQEQRKKYGDEA